MIDLGKKIVTGKLKDPESATFKNARVYYNGGATVVCGEVNSRNSFGGMAGFQRFVSAGSNATFLEEQMTRGTMNETWARFCK